jgi:beta-galactosidase
MMRWVSLVCFVTAAAMQAQHFDISPRIEMNFSTGWLYVADDFAGAERTELDDSKWEPVSVPHANVLTPHETFDPDVYRIVSWYRKHFRPDLAWKGRKVYARFQAVMTVAAVYLNGSLLGAHKGGYTPFAVDLTPALRFDEENVLAVRVDSRVQKDVPPEGAPKVFGFYLFGGIYRDVELLVVDPLHVEWAYYTTPKIAPEAVVEAQVRVRNEGPATDATMTVRLLNEQGGEAASGQASVRIGNGAYHDFRIGLSPVRQPKLWHPNQPNRYVALAQVRSGGKVTDRHRTWIGIREIGWAEDGRFRINGQPLKIRGMNRHQTFPYVGGAAPNRLQRRDAQILKFEMGLNAVRTSHYPQDPEFLDECDRIGLLVMEEFPAWQYIGKSAEWQENGVQAVRDMVLRDRNHPSIILWGVRGNEASPREEDDREFYSRTYSAAKELDPTRAPCGARLSDAWHGKFVPEEVVTVNDYSDWGDSAGWPQPSTAKPWLLTEFGHPRQFPVWESESSLLAFTRNWARYLDGIYRRADIAGGFGWAAFDYNSPEFNTPVAVTAHHCVNDIFRLRKGFSSWFLASQGDAQVYGPVVRVLSYHRRKTPEILVASNAEEVELAVNGRSLGRKKPTEYPNLPHPLFLFRAGEFEEGELKATAWIGGKPAEFHSVRTPGVAKTLQLAPDDEELIGDGADMTRVVAYAMDANGTVAPYEDRRIHIDVANGRFIGESPIHLEGGRIAFFVQTRLGRHLPISMRVKGEGLEPAQARIRVRPPAGDLVPLSDFDVEEIQKVILNPRNR